MLSIPRLVLSLVLAATFTMAASTPTAKTELGTINGKACSSSANAFLGIPFAEPPTGDLRFAPPVAYNTSYPSAGYNATTKTLPCIQFGNEFVEDQPWSEDCLFLNVWVPSNASPELKLPVKFWIHGGGSTVGAPSNPTYDGCNLATDAIVVSTAYRLGPLGFLTLPPAGIQGNMGVQDILLALEWVQHNIAAFGGDPNHVLLFGQSAGAALTWVISSLPQAPKLIKAAIAESGAGGRRPSSESLNVLADLFAENLNCSVNDISCLRSKPTTLMNTSLPQLPDGSPVTRFGPFVDGKIIPDDPMDVGSRVPLVAGANTQEGTLFIVAEANNLPLGLTESDYRRYLQKQFGDNSTTVAKRFPVSNFNNTVAPVFEAMSYMYTLLNYACPTRAALEATRKAGVPAWTYRFGAQPTCAWYDKIEGTKEALEILGATHTAEIPFVFSLLTDLPPPNGTCSFNGQEVAISKALVAAWTSMAAAGNPNDASASALLGGTWPEWEASSSLGLVVDDRAPSLGVVDFSPCDFVEKYYIYAANEKVSGSSKNASATVGRRRRSYGGVRLA